jgi:hypothetical protein
VIESREPKTTRQVEDRLYGEGPRAHRDDQDRLLEKHETLAIPSRARPSHQVMRGLMVQ